MLRDALADSYGGLIAELLCSDRMLKRLLIWLCGLSPAFRRMLWRWWYNKLARQIAARDWTFMNYGFQAPPTEPPLPLSPADEVDRLCISLYDRVTRDIDLIGLNIMEVGSGRGGGASFIARYRQTASVLGLDYSREASAFCERRHAEVPNLRFQVGDAENLPLEDGVFDAVINVESSHCYGDVERFFSEVERVLRPGGHFLFADLREPAEMEQLKSQLRSSSGLEVIAEENISAGVVAALEADDQRKRRLIHDLVPPAIRPLFEEFAGLQNGTIHNGLKNGGLVYWRLVLRKK
jgi:SAM-dependent methyltransferase